MPDGAGLSGLTYAICRMVSCPWSVVRGQLSVVSCNRPQTSDFGLLDFTRNSADRFEIGVQLRTTDSIEYRFLPPSQRIANHPHIARHDRRERVGREVIQIEELVVVGRERAADDAAGEQRADDLGLIA